MGCPGRRSPRSAGDYPGGRRPRPRRVAALVVGAVEAMAAGRPVVAYAAGGALDTVVDGKTGVFFKEATAAS
ncbi:MAG: glycosyltransferase, partial [Mycobacterium sp.]